MQKLQDALEAIKKAASTGKLNAAARIQWCQRTKSNLTNVLGAKSSLIQKLDSWLKEFKSADFPIAEFQARVDEVANFVQHLAIVAGTGSCVPVSQASPHPNTNEVFIIHGHDETNRLRLSELLRSEFHLDPIVILARAGQSQPTIQKFESAASKCAYAFALFTPDDFVSKSESESYAQARPNVIFEVGWFVGRLGKERVLLIVREGTKLHSDFDGLNRIEFRDSVEDRFVQIKRELQAAGFAHV